VINAIADASPIHAEGVRRTRGFVQVGFGQLMRVAMATLEEDALFGYR
jgi:hypothetical protein